MMTASFHNLKEHLLIVENAENTEQSKKRIRNSALTHCPEETAMDILVYFYSTFKNIFYFYIFYTVWTYICIHAS